MTYILISFSDVRRWLIQRRVKRLFEAKAHQERTVNSLLTTMTVEGSSCYGRLQTLNQEDTTRSDKSRREDGQEKKVASVKRGQAQVEEGWEAVDTRAGGRVAPKGKQITAIPGKGNGSPPLGYILPTSPRFHSVPQPQTEEKPEMEEIYDDVSNISPARRVLSSIPTHGQSLHDDSQRSILEEIATDDEPEDIYEDTGAYSARRLRSIPSQPRSRLQNEDAIIVVSNGQMATALASSGSYPDNEELYVNNSDFMQTSNPATTSPNWQSDALYADIGTVLQNSLRPISKGARKAPTRYPSDEPIYDDTESALEKVGSYSMMDESQDEGIYNDPSNLMQTGPYSTMAQDEGIYNDPSSLMQTAQDEGIYNDPSSLMQTAQDEGIYNDPSSLMQTAQDEGIYNDPSSLMQMQGSVPAAPAGDEVEEIYDDAVGITRIPSTVFREEDSNQLYSDPAALMEMQKPWSTIASKVPGPEPVPIYEVVRSANNSSAVLSPERTREGRGGGGRNRSPSPGPPPVPLRSPRTRLSSLDLQQDAPPVLPPRSPKSTGPRESRLNPAASRPPRSTRSPTPPPIPARAPDTKLSTGVQQGGSPRRPSAGEPELPPRVPPRRESCSHITSPHGLKPRKVSGEGISVSPPSPPQKSQASNPRENLARRKGLTKALSGTSISQSPESHKSPFLPQGNLSSVQQRHQMRRGSEPYEQTFRQNLGIIEVGREKLAQTFQGGLPQGMPVGMGSKAHGPIRDERRISRQSDAMLAVSGGLKKLAPVGRPPNSRFPSPYEDAVPKTTPTPIGHSPHGHSAYPYEDVVPKSIPKPASHPLPRTSYENVTLESFNSAGRAQVTQSQAAPLPPILPPGRANPANSSQAPQQLKTIPMMADRLLAPPPPPVPPMHSHPLAPQGGQSIPNPPPQPPILALTATSPSQASRGNKATPRLLPVGGAAALPPPPPCNEAPPTSKQAPHLSVGGGPPPPPPPPPIGGVKPGTGATPTSQLSPNPQSRRRAVSMGGDLPPGPPQIGDLLAGLSNVKLKKASGRQLPGKYN